MSDPIAAAIAAAKQAAPPALPVVAASAAAPARRFSMDDFVVGGMSVDAWLKVKEYGLIVGNSAVLLPSVVVSIDMKEVQINQTIKFGNPAQYLKTYDGTNCAQGGTWDQAQARARSVDPNARPYFSADIPMGVIEDIKTPDGNTVLIEKGKRLGHALSTTNKGNFQEFLKALTDAGQLGIPVRVKVSSARRTNQKGNAWGVLTFELLGPVATA